MMPGRVLVDLAARFTPDPFPRAPHSAHSSPTEPDTPPRVIRVSPAPSRAPKSVQCPPLAYDARILLALAELTDDLDDPLAAAQRLFAPELLETPHA